LQRNDFELFDAIDVSSLSVESLLVKRFMNLSKSESRIVEIPRPFVLQILQFYATFIAIAAPLEIPLIEDTLRDSIAQKIVRLSLELKVDSNLFDSVADIVLEGLFIKTYSKYLEIKGTSLTILSKLNSIFNEKVESRPRQSQELILNELEKKHQMKYKDFQSISLKNSKDCFLKTIFIPELKQKFEKYLDETHCRTNLLFIESFIKLEARARNSTDSACIKRFLHPTEMMDKDTKVPINLVPLFMLMFHAFIVPGAPLQINIPNSLGKEIGNAFQQSTSCLVFDKVADHVLEMVYSNSFSSFVQKYNQN
jgi:hypothetical protein